MKRLTKMQMCIFAVGQLGWSTLGAVILGFYGEKKIMKTIAKAGEENFIKINKE